jgi:hypothetical protein
VANDLLANQLDHAIPRKIRRDREIAGAEEAAGVELIDRTTHEEQIDPAQPHHRTLQRPLN